MKKLSLILISLIITISNITAQDTYVPDDNFEQALIDAGYDSGALNDYVPTANINSVTILDITNKKISDLTGIEDFVSLSKLYCSDNLISNLDLSQNTNLNYLFCQNNQITDINISQCTLLEEFICNNNQIINIDASNNTNLVAIICNDNQLTELDIRNSNNINISDAGFNTTNNPDLVCIFVDDASWSQTNWTNIDATSTFMETVSDCSLYTKIQDDNFEQALIDLGYDNSGLDDYVRTASIDTITSLDIHSKDISDLTGIDAFRDLEHFSCDFNDITNIDLSNNLNLITLNCNNNFVLTDINISQNTNLTTLYCSYNNLTNIDISANTNLTMVLCNNNQITSLDVSNNGSLNALDCSRNQITELDISQNPNINGLFCNNNLLTNFNIRNGNNINITNTNFNATSNPDLTCIFVDDASWSETNWTNIDATSTFVETQTECDVVSGLVTFVPDDNFEQALIDAGYDSGALNDYVPTANIENLINLDLYNKNISDLTGIEDFTNLQELYCDNNQLTNLNLSQNTNLNMLSCGGNQLTNIDISQNTLLEIFDCSMNLLTSLNVSQNTSLNILVCDGNQISNLDLSNNNLGSLYCSSNQLTSLDVSLNTNLTYLECNNNQIIDLDISNNTNIESFICNNNQLTNLDIRNENNINITNTSFNTTNNPDLTCIFVDDASWSETNWTNIDVTSTFVETQEECDDLTVATTYIPDDNFEQALIDLGYDSGELNDYIPTTNISSITSLDIHGKSISNLTGIEDFTNLQEIFCDNNQLTNIDFSNNINLTGIYCHYNQLTNINITQNNLLRDFVCDNNQLTNIDISQNTSLEHLNCSVNLLTSLDISQNTSLNILVCDENQISSLDLSNNNLGSLNCNSNQLTSLDVSLNTNLTYLECNNNQITNLDISNNTNIESFICNNNQLTNLDIRNGNNINITNTNFNATNNPNLTCIFVDDANYSQTNWVDIDDTSTFIETEDECDALSDVYKIENNKISIFPNPTNSNFIINSKNDILKTVTISDITGKIINTISTNKNKILIDLRKEIQGVYFIKINTNNNIYIYKLVKQ